MHMVQLSENTSGVSSSDWLNYSGFPGDVCVASFNVSPGNKDAVVPNPLTKEKSFYVYKCDGERLSGSTKRWIFKSMWNISSLRHIIFKICPRVSHTLVCYCGDLSTPRNVSLNLTNCDWLFDMGGPWPMNAAIYSRPSAVSLKVWLLETSLSLVKDLNPCRQDAHLSVTDYGKWNLT